MTEASSSKRPRKSFYQRHEAFILGGGAVFIVFAIWEWMWQAKMISPLFFSGPSAIWKRFWADLTMGDLVADLLFTGKNYLIGLAAALVVGVALGMIIGWYKRIGMVLNPFLIALNATPRTAMMPLIIIWFGIEDRPKIFMVFLSAVFPLLINTVGGMKAIDRDLLRAARAFCASDWQIFKTVALPGAVPFILTGVRQGVALGLIGVVISEMLAGSQGIGFKITYGGQTFATDTLFTGIIIIALAGIILTALAEKLEKRFSEWRPER